MRLEEMRDSFPKMPESMRKMVENEVKKQIKIVPAKQHFTMKKAVIASLVATMALGTTVFAGVKLFQMKNEQIGNYGLTTKIEQSKTTEQATASSEAVTVPAVSLEVAYLPDGMVQMEEEKYSYEATPYQGGISLVFYGMDQGDDAFEVLDTGVVASEAIQVGTHDGVYLQFQNSGDENILFNQRIYVSYPELHYVMEMYVGEDVTKEEAIKVAEGVTLTATDSKENAVQAYTWSDYVESKKEDKQLQDSGEFDIKLSASAEEMKQAHAIGDTFSVPSFAKEQETSLQVKVSDVQVLDNISVLDESYVGDELRQIADENGVLKDATINYVKSGDGIDSVDETVETKTVPRKLVYVTVEYTNMGEADLTEILYNICLVKIKEQGDNYQIYEGKIPEEGAAWDRAVDTGNSSLLSQEMYYYDVRGGERGNNYISELKTGETKTIHVGFIVNEDELQYMYLNADPQGGCFEFSESMLATGLIDIRK